MYVCDDHNEVLPWLHTLIRRRTIPYTGLSLLHIDAHADLSVPTSMSATRYLKDGAALCQYLRDSPAGIAEFIVPLVAAGHVTHMCWLRSPWTTSQFDRDGFTLVEIGQIARPPPSIPTSTKHSIAPATSTATADDDSDSDHDGDNGDDGEDTVLRVACAAPYYIDDHQGSMYVERTTMIANTIRPLSLYIHALPQPSSPPSSSSPSLQQPLSVQWLPTPIPPAINQDDKKLLAEQKQSTSSSSNTVRLTRDWILDICLDYFSTLNPFYLRLQKELSQTIIDALLPVYTRPSFQRT